MKSFPSFSWSALIVVFALAVSGCASGPKYADMQPNIQAPSGENGRIYVYRTSVFGAAIQPSVKINGEVVGDAVPDGFFYVDRPPGNYKITTTTEVERDLSLALEPGQTRYVRLAISMGFFAGHVSPELVDSTEGQKDISTLHYTGK